MPQTLVEPIKKATDIYQTHYPRRHPQSTSQIRSADWKKSASPQNSRVTGKSVPRPHHLKCLQIVTELSFHRIKSFYLSILTQIATSRGI
jgi:hypothetical protein